MIALTLVGIVVGAAVLTKVTGFVIRRLVRRAAEANLDRPPRFWRARVARVGYETPEVGESRRRQRVDAAARGVNHLVALIVWVMAAIVVFHVLDIDAAFFLSSAGFIGAALSFGGAHKVNDYFTGLSVLFEDRYGVGDDVDVTVANGGPDVRATVEHVGLMTTRLRDESSSYHVPNGQIALIRNHSQDPTSTRLQISVAADDGADHSYAVMRALREQAGSTHLTDVFFIGDLNAEQTSPDTVNVDVKTIKPLDNRSKRVLVQKAENALRGVSRRRA